LIHDVDKCRYLLTVTRWMARSVHVIRLDETEMHTKFHSESLKERIYLGDLGTDGVNIKTDLRKISCVDWLQVAQDKVQLRAFVNTVMNLWVP